MWNVRQIAALSEFPVTSCVFRSVELSFCGRNEEVVSLSLPRNIERQCVFEPRTAFSRILWSARRGHGAATTRPRRAGAATTRPRRAGAATTCRRDHDVLRNDDVR